MYRNKPPSTQNFVRVLIVKAFIMFRTRKMVRNWVNESTNKFISNVPLYLVFKRTEIYEGLSGECSH
jgi:hypothetical protein